jgi:2-iminobutanoate/2-iminopropanoate deaminase
MPAPRGPYVHAVEHEEKAWLSGTVDPCVGGDARLAVETAFGRLGALAAEVGVVPAFMRIYLDVSLPLTMTVQRLAQMEVSALAGSIVPARLGGQLVEVEVEGGESVVGSGHLDHGPFAAATRAGGIVYLSGQIGTVSDGKEIVEGGAEAEAWQIFAKLETALTPFSLDLSSIVKTTLYLTELSDFESVNEVYREVFGDRPVARTTLGVGALPGGARVQVDAIAVHRTDPAKEEQG